MIKTYINGVLQESGGSVALRHNQLIGLNDDVNFQHITSADRTKLNNLSGTNTGDETASTIITKIGDGSKINSNYLPSYVDDVLEFANVASFPVTGEVGKIYIALDVNLTYRWGGSSYIEISPSIALGETSATAYRGDRGKIAYDHSQLTSGTNPHNTTFANIASKPTTVAGFGITDAVTLTGAETLTNKTLTAPILNTEVTGTGVTTTGEASKLLKFSSVANTLLHFLRIRKSSISAFNVQDDSSADVFNVDTTNKAVSTSGSIFSTMSNATKTKNLTLTNSNLLGETSIIFKQDVANDLAEISQVRNGYDGRLRLKVSDVSGVMNTCMEIKGSDKSVTLPSLAGTGTRMVVADSSGNLSAFGSKIQRVNSVNITSTSYVNIGVTLPSSLVNDILIGFYNTSVGSQGHARFLKSTTSGLTQIAFYDGTECGVSFQASGQELQAKVTTGSVAFQVKVESL